MSIKLASLAIVNFPWRFLDWWDNNNKNKTMRMFDRINCNNVQKQNVLWIYCRRWGNNNIWLPRVNIPPAPHHHQQLDTLPSIFSSCTNSAPSDVSPDSVFVCTGRWELNNNSDCILFDESCSQNAGTTKWCMGNVWCLFAFGEM